MALHPDEELYILPKPTIGEELFKKTYLPLIFDADPSVFNKRWIQEVAGSPYVEVEILESVDKVLFVVPSITDRFVSKVTNEINLLAVRYLKETERIQSVAQSNFNNALPKMIDVESRMLDATREERWRSILIRYDLGDKIAYSRTESNSILNQVSNVSVDDNEEW